MTRHSLQGTQCRTTRGEARCHRNADHEGPHRSPYVDESGAEWIRWWFTNDHGWVAPIKSEPLKMSA